VERTIGKQRAGLATPGASHALGWRGIFFIGVLPALHTACLRSNTRAEARRPLDSSQQSVKTLVAPGYTQAIWAAANDALLHRRPVVI
jgi:hypothetical protein